MFLKVNRALSEQIFFYYIQKELIEILKPASKTFDDQIQTLYIRTAIIDSMGLNGRSRNYGLP